MLIQPIRSDDQLHAALERIDALLHRELSASEESELEVLSDLVEHYEAKHHAVPAADPVDVIRLFMEERKLSQRALAAKAGLTGARVSEVLGRKRGLTLSMVHKLAAALDLPASALMGMPARASAEEEPAIDGLVAAVCAEAQVDPAKAVTLLRDAWNSSHARSIVVGVGGFGTNSPHLSMAA